MIYDSNSLYPTTIIAAENDPAISRTTVKNYDFFTGVVTLVKDQDNDIPKIIEYDDYGRPILLREAAGKSVRQSDGISSRERKISTEYVDAIRRVTIKSDLIDTGDQKLISVYHYDPLGRLSLTQRFE